MKKLCLVLAIILSGCIAGQETEESADEIVETTDDEMANGHGVGSTYDSGCGYEIKSFKYDGGVFIIKIPNLCSTYWADMGDPPPSEERENSRSNPDPTEEQEDFSAPIQEINY